MKFIKKRLWTFFTMVLVVSMTMVVMVPMINVASASPGTHFYVDPPEVKNVMPGSPPNDRFLINISVTDAPDSYAWEIFLSWDPALLELALVSEGDFLNRGAYPTDLLYSPSLPNANAAGEIMISCSLKGEVPWASGDGWLCKLGFIVETTGSCVLNIYQTRLWDHLEAGLPAHTYYPNLDCFFYNEAFHDISINNIGLNDTEMWVNSPESIAIDVTVKNEGNFTETFDVTVYADTEVYNTTVDWWIDEIIVGDEITVGTQTVTSLAQDATTTLNFTWDTSGIDSGNWTISAEVLGDDDKRDSLLIDGAVLIREHDLEILDAVGDNVHVGKIATVSVMVLDNGTEPETFDITVYAETDTGTIGDEITIGTIPDVSLGAGEKDIFDILWNTTGVAEDIYTICAYVPPVIDPPNSEMDTADNTHIGSDIWVLFLSDIRGTEDPVGSGLYPPDGKVDYYDLTFMGKAFGIDDGDPDWIKYEIADITGPEDPPDSGLYPPDGKVEYCDLTLMSEQFGKSILD